jgi:hypothetical protein
MLAQASAGTLSLTGALPSLPDPGQTVSKSITNSFTSLLTFGGRVIRLPGGHMG